MCVVFERECEVLPQTAARCTNRLLKGNPMLQHAFDFGHLGLFIFPFLTPLHFAWQKNLQPGEVFYVYEAG